MERRILLFYALLLLIMYVMASYYWVNRYLDSKESGFKSQFVKRSDEDAIYSYLSNTTAATKRPSTSHPRVNASEAYQKLNHFLQSEWPVNSSSQDFNSFNKHRKFIGKFISFTASNANEDAINAERDISKTNISHSRTCRELVSGDDFSWKETIRLIKEKHKKSRPKYRKDDVMAQIFSRCIDIRDFLHFKAGSVVNHTDIQIAYSVLVNRPADQTLQLIRAIYDPSNAYCLHVDSHATQKFYSIMKKLSSCVDNIYLAANRYDVAFPTSKRIEAHLACFRTLLRVPVAWRYIFSISGSVYPLRNNSVILDYLRQKSYSNGILPRESSLRFIRRTKFVHIFREVSGSRKVFMRTKKLKQPPPQNVTLFRGENSFLATREFTEFATTSTQARELLQWSRDTRYPDEFFWATLDRVPGAPGGSPAQQEEDELKPGLFGKEEDIGNTRENFLVARLPPSNGSSAYSCRYRGSICTFNYVNLRWLLNQDNLFAGPFDMGVDRIVLECLYQNLRKPLIEDVNF